MIETLSFNDWGGGPQVQGRPFINTSTTFAAERCDEQVCKSDASCCSVWLSNRHLELYLTHCSAAAADTVKKRVKTWVAKCAPLDNDGHSVRRATQGPIPI